MHDIEQSKEEIAAKHNYIELAETLSKKLSALLTECKSLISE